MSSFYTSVPKIMIICYTVLEIWYVMYVIVVSILGNFLPFYPPNSPKNEYFIKMKKKPGDVIILHKCAKNHNYMLYFSWDMACDGCNCYFSFWAIFCPSTSLTAQKIKISWKSKKVLEISSSHTCVPKIMIRWCSVPEIRCMTHRWTDIQMDGGSKKWHIEVGAPPKKRGFAITNIKTGLFLRGM